MSGDVVWQSVVTADLVPGLTPEEIASMVSALDDAVADIVESFTVGGAR